jgi:hypothetical protein
MRRAHYECAFVRIHEIGFVPASICAFHGEPNSLRAIHQRARLDANRLSAQALRWLEGNAMASADAHVAHVAQELFNYYDDEMTELLVNAGLHNRWSDEDAGDVLPTAS